MWRSYDYPSFFSFMLYRQQTEKQDNENLNVSLMNLSLECPEYEVSENEQITKCICKGTCVRRCPCIKDYVKCGKLCKCKDSKCKNRPEEVSFVLISINP